MTSQPGAGSDARPDLSARLAETAARDPGAVALISADGRTSYGELDGEVTRVAAGLQRLGVRPGDRVGLLLGNTPHFVAAFLGALRAGATAVPMNTLLTAPEVRHIVADSGCRVVVASTEVWEGTLRALRPDDLPVETVVVAGTADRSEGASLVTWDELASPVESFDEPERAPDDLAALVYTSGTTGEAKGAMLTRANLAANQDQVLGTRLGVTRDDVLLAVLPLFHIYALNVGLGTSVRVGATIVLEERFDPVETLRQIERHRVTVLVGAPPMYVAWTSTPGIDGADLSSVRVAVSGAAPLPAAVLERFREVTGITIWEGYGLTEAAPAVTSNAMGEEAKPGSVGRPLPGVEARLVRDGEDVALGDPGEVWVRGENVFAGYWNDQAATDEVLTPDGWLRTGDVGILDDDGYLHLVDRVKDLIIVSGFNVYPREVEEQLNEHPGIAAVAVVGEPHPYTGESVKAFVVPRHDAGDLTPSAVIDWARGRLARFKCPEEVEIVDELPTTATGKIRRAELRGDDG